MTNWRDGMTPEQVREAEMKRGTEVIVEKHDAVNKFLAEQFDEHYTPPTPTHFVSKEGKEYARKLRESNNNRPDFQ